MEIPLSRGQMAMSPDPGICGGRVSRTSFFGILLGATLVLSACSIQESAGQTQAAPVAGSGDGLMLVFLREFSFVQGIDDITDENEIISCVGRAIRNNRPSQRLIKFETFRRVAFPHLTSAATPRQPEYIALMLKDPVFRERIAPLGLRHIAFVGGVTQISGPQGGVSCVSGPGPYGFCVGGWKWDKESRVGASILDVEDMERAQQVQATATGTPWFAIIGAFPIGLPAATEAAACADLGRRIGQFLDKSSSDPRNEPPVDPIGGITADEA